MKYKTVNGFTLVELMSVVAVIAILSAIAIPSYLSYAEKTRRSDAKVSLVELSQLQESYYSDNNRYAKTMAELFPTIKIADTDVDTKTGKGFGSKTKVPCTVTSTTACSKEGYYEIRLTTGTATNYVLEAKPPTTGAQAKDTKCTSFTLNATGTKGATGTLGTECW
ncbi:type IV pilin protein [Beggiatoa leptomitoformis]|uniref:Prepilin-type N-terminal cleavage/methylation domain-containing protein n=1 Tax=Beggiatoa leptomitoformis TaxID=288004 RepID=A0A2N9YDR0_9GAMM|nr:type IV pilin protein [Beggiatoa leptomitoformis]ALG68979.1 prepilin-type N-terminal cleavage/methylation domain-containing protein [Beggiatoa leptomitoformis]AUI68628.1 prepilin-type N-terminal cleavage/methylation domain-containing protein [Beggiatoa leptomitoformis]